MATITREMLPGELERSINSILRDFLEKTDVYEDENGELYIDIYADYRDEISDKDISEIVSSDDPEMALEEKLRDRYYEGELDARNALSEMVADELEKIGIEADDDEVRDVLLDLVYVKYPVDNYLDQQVCVNIFVDTGDGNGDYVSNDIAPAYCSYYTQGDGDEPVIPDEASIGWLIRQQGYKPSHYTDFVKSDAKESGSSFLDSIYQEAANIANHMNILTFTVSMTLGKLMEINQLMRLQTAKYDNRENPDCGTIILGKETNCGFYDLWGGGGSLLGIELEKDVELPIKFIRSALPDGEDGYAIESVYGMMRSFWKESLKEILPPADEQEVAA